MASEHHHLQLEKPPYPKVERPQVGRIKQRAERSNHKINLCAIRTSIGRDLGGPHLSIIQGGPELEVLFLPPTVLFSLLFALPLMHQFPIVMPVLLQILCLCEIPVMVSTSLLVSS